MGPSKGDYGAAMWNEPVENRRVELHPIPQPVNPPPTRGQNQNPNRPSTPPFAPLIFCKSGESVGTARSSGGKIISSLPRVQPNRIFGTHRVNERTRSRGRVAPARSDAWPRPQ